jgi:hypothetical protein
VTESDPTPQLQRLPGVVAASAFLDQPTPLIYLATTPDADRDALRQAVVTLLDGYGRPTPPDRVQFGMAMGRGAPPLLLARVSLDALDVARSQGRIDCTVRLRSGERETAGEATEPDTPSGPLRVAARATLRAAEALDPDYRFGLEGVRVLDMLGEPVVLVLVDARAGRGHARLPGSALVDRPAEEAAALAVLHALRSWGP